MAYTKLIPQHTQAARVEEISAGNHYRLLINTGGADTYRLAQLDDYAKMARRNFHWRFPARLQLSARASSHSLPGTWGFGFWNDPFGMSLGFGGTGWRLPTLPNAAWFFQASKENYLSFKYRAGLDADRKYSVPAQPALEAANGFLAQSFRSPTFHPLLIPAGLAFPFSRKLTRRLLGKVIGEDGINLRSQRSLDDTRESTSYTGLDVTLWHTYRLEWRENSVLFEVDGVPVLESPVSPKSPLGLVIWIDNQYAAFTPAGRIGFGVLENPGPAWLEVKDIECVGLNV